MKEYIITDDFLDDLTKKFASAQGQLKELIRCKDCIYWRKSNIFTNTMACHYVIGHEYYREADGYCSQAERKEE